MFSVTLINLSADGRTATEGARPLDLGRLTPSEFSALLDAFATIDEIQNLKSDPEIRVQTKRERFTIRTGDGKLFLYDARRPNEPAYVYSSAQIIAELDGSAADQRTSAPFVTLTAKERSQPAVEAPPSPEELATIAEFRPTQVPWFLIVASVALAGLVAVVAETSSSNPDLPPLTPLAKAEQTKEDAAVTGVYMTSNLPNGHGIAVLGDGNLKLFTINAQAAPSVVLGSFKFGRIGETLYLATNQPGGLIKVIDPKSLEFCGLVFSRVQ